MAEERLTDDPMKKNRPDDGLFEVEGEDYDDDLVGLTPGQLDEELERRKLAASRARAERERQFAEAEAKLAGGDFSGAETIYRRYAEEGDAEAECGLWRARTQNLTDVSCFARRRTARQFARAGEQARACVLGVFGEQLEGERAACEEQAEALRGSVYGAMESRRGAFRDNRNYYLVRFGCVAAVFLAVLVTCIVCATYIVRSRGILFPVLTAVFGGLSLAVLAVLLVFSRKLYVAQRLVSDNEKLSSTEDGARLASLEQRAELLKLVLEGEAEDFSAYNGEDGEEEIYEEGADPEGETPEEDGESGPLG